MGCGSCGKAKTAIANIVKAGSQQPDKLMWFVDGLTGLIRSAGGSLHYDVSGVKSNRDSCRDCEHATKNGVGELHTLSQCMAPDPTKNGAACGCFILAKTEVGECPLGRWTATKITISGR